MESVTAGSPEAENGSQETSGVLAPPHLEKLDPQLFTEIKQVSEDIEVFEGLASISNPFGKGVSEEAEPLRFIGLKYRKFIESLKFPEYNPEQFAESLSGRSGLSFTKTYGKLMKAAEISLVKQQKAAEFAGYELDAASEEIKTYHQELVEKPVYPDPNIIKDFFKRLSDIAAQRPSATTIKLAANLYEAAGITARRAGDKGAVLAENFGGKLARSGSGRVEDLRTWLDTNVELADAVFGLAKSMPNYGQRLKSVRMLALLDQAHSLLQNTKKNLNPEELLEAEAFIVSKAQWAVDKLQGVDSGPDKDPDLHRTIQRLLTPTYLTTVRETAQREQEEAAAGFNRQVTEARDILKGGRRLEKPGKSAKARSVAAELYELADKHTGHRLFLPEQKGMVVAILRNKFTGFIDAVSRIQVPADKIVRTVEQQRPDTVRELRNFDLNSQIKRLHSICSNPGHRLLLATVLSESELSTLDSALEEFVNRDSLNKG